MSEQIKSYYSYNQRDSFPSLHTRTPRCEYICIYYSARQHNLNTHFMINGCSWIKSLNAITKISIIHLVICKRNGAHNIKKD